MTEENYLTEKELERYEIVLDNYEDVNTALKNNEVKYFYLINESLNKSLHNRIKESKTKEDLDYIVKVNILSQRINDLLQEKIFAKLAREKK